MNRDLDQLKFAETHEWVYWDEEGCLYVGISDYAQDSLGDIVYVDLPKIGDNLNVGEAAVVIESVKAAAEVYAPVVGTVADINNALTETPELINEDCYGEGWILRIKPAENDGLEHLLKAKDYQKLCDQDSD